MCSYNTYTSTVQYSTVLLIRMLSIAAGKVLVYPTYYNTVRYVSGDGEQPLLYLL